MRCLKTLTRKKDITVLTLLYNWDCKAIRATGFLRGQTHQFEMKYLRMQQE